MSSSTLKNSTADGGGTPGARVSGSRTPGALSDGKRSDGKRASGVRLGTGTTGKKSTKHSQMRGENQIAPVKKKRRKFPIFFWTALLVVILLYAFYKSTVKPPEITPVPTPTAPVPTSGPQEPNDDPEQPDVDTEPVAPGLQRKEDFYTFLIVGTDKAGANTDVLMVASFDAKNKQAHVINIPRDTLVNVPRKVKKINAAYAVGGMDNLMEEVSTLIGFKPDHHMMIDLKGFVALVNAFGGVDFNVPVNMNYDDPSQDLSIHFKKGMQHLDGKSALEVVRFRHNNDGTGYLRQDLDRIQTTQNLLKAVAKKMMTPKTLLKINDLVEIAVDNLDSSLQFGEMLWFAKEGLGFDSEEGIHFYTLAEDNAMYKGLSYVFVNEEEALELINATINPYTTDITDLDVIQP